MATLIKRRSRLNQTRRAACRLLILAAAIDTLANGPSQAADNTCTIPTTNIPWNTTSANWTNPTIWNNSNIDNAIFSLFNASGINIPVSVPITTGGIRFDSVGYSLNGGTITLAAGGSGSLAAGEIQTNAPTLITSVLAGTTGVTKTGTATLTLTGANTYSGGTTISAGTIDIGGGGSTGSVAGDITNNASLVYNVSSSPIYNGVISGSGSFTKLGAGALQLGGALNHTGGTTISAGEVMLKPGFSINTLGNVSVSALLTFSMSGTQTYSGVISGIGSVRNVSATTILTGTNTYTGGTTITSGTLQLGNGGTTGSVVGNITNNATLNFFRSDNITFGAVISGTGAVTKLSVNTLTLTGANTYSGITTISAGTLDIGGGTTAGQVSGNIVNNASLLFNRSNTITYSGVISGTGTLTKINSNTLVLAGANTYTGVTTISSGTLDIGGGGSGIYAIAGNITNNANLTFNTSGTITYGGIVSGTGSVNKLGSGALILTGAFNHTGGITFNTSTVKFQPSFNVASMGNIVTSGSILFGMSTPQTYAGVISGTGVMNQTLSTLTLTGNHTYTGGTILMGSGGLQLGNGGTSGSVVGNIANGTSLIFNRVDAVSYGGVISGVGTVTKLANNTLILTGENTYTGGTTISGGTLEIGGGGTTGSIAGNIVNNATIQFNRSNTIAYAGNISGVGGLNKLGSSSLTLSGNLTYSSNTSVQAGKLITSTGLKNGTPVLISNAAVLEVPANGSSSGVTSISSLTITGANSRMEIHNNDLVLNYTGNPSTYAATVSKVKSGLKLLGGTGTIGITSAEVDAQTILGTVLAVVDNNVVGGAISGTSGFNAIPEESVIVKYTWFGDANLDGLVDGSDYALTDTGFTSGGSLTGWVFGDYDYNGLVDAGDYALLDTGFIAQTGALPEPASISLLLFTATSFLRRKRR